MSDNGSVTTKTRKTRSNGLRVNTSKTTSHSDKRRLPSNLVDLTPAERRLLHDPDWIDEDESDLLLAMRRERTEADSAIPFEQVLEEFGYKLDDFLPARRKARTPLSES